MALCYMPETHIRPLFTDLEREANSPALQKLVDYIRTTWIYSNTFSQIGTFSICLFARTMTLKGGTTA